MSTTLRQMSKAIIKANLSIAAAEESLNMDSKSRAWLYRRAANRVGEVLNMAQSGPRHRDLLEKSGMGLDLARKMVGLAYACEDQAEED